MLCNGAVRIQGNQTVCIMVNKLLTVDVLLAIISLSEISACVLRGVSFLHAAAIPGSLDAFYYLIDALQIIGWMRLFK